MMAVKKTLSRGELLGVVAVGGFVLYNLLGYAITELQQAPEKVKVQLTKRLDEVVAEAERLDDRQRAAEKRLTEVAGDARSASEKAGDAAKSAEKAVEGIQSLRELILQQQRQQQQPPPPSYPYPYPPPTGSPQQ